MAAARVVEDPKVAALREARCLNPHTGRVRAPVFMVEEFFDVRDLVQVKYEMVRAVLVDGSSVTAAAAAFGFSRTTYYQAAEALAERGLDGLVPGKPGPKQGHKLTDEICAWCEERLAADPALRPAALVDPIEEEFGKRVHPRTIERAVARRREHSKSR
jgi:transposase